MLYLTTIVEIGLMERLLEKHERPFVAQTMIISPKYIGLGLYLYSSWIIKFWIISTCIYAASRMAGSC